MFYSLSKTLRKVSVPALFIVVLAAGAVILLQNIAILPTLDKEKKASFSPNNAALNKIKYAGLFPWFDQKTLAEGERLLFKAAKIAPNGNGIFSGIASPGNSVFLKDRQNADVGFAKSDPEGQWVAIVQKPLSNSTKTYSLHSQSPDGETKHISKQKLEIEIPEDKTLGARIKVLEKGQQPVILAQNLLIPEAGIISVALSTQAMAADTPPKSSNREKVAVLKSEYQDAKQGSGKINLSGTSEKNANLTIFINEAEIGKTQADENGKWALLEDYAAKPGAQNNVRVEQRDKNNKVLSTGSRKYEHVTSVKGALGQKTEEEVAATEGGNGALGQAKKETTFWQKFTGFFGSSDPSAGDAKKDGGDKTSEQQNADAKDGNNNDAANSSDSNTNTNGESDLAGGRLGSDPASSGFASGQREQAEKAKKKAVKVARNGAPQSGSSDLGKSDMSRGADRAKENSPFVNEGPSTQAKNDTSTNRRASNSRYNIGRNNKGRKASNRKARKRGAKRSARRSTKSRSRSKRRASRYSRAKRKSRARKRHVSKKRYTARKRKFRRSASLRRRLASKRRARNIRKRRRAKRNRYLARRASRSRRYRRGKNMKRYANRRRYKRQVAVKRRKFRRSRRRIAAIRRNRRVRVRRGDTLWELARIKYGHGRHYRKIYRANRRRLSNPNRLSPNQRLFLPA